jgi:hypothetical protein
MTRDRHFAGVRVTLRHVDALREKKQHAQQGTNFLS